MPDNRPPNLTKLSTLNHYKDRYLLNRMSSMSQIQLMTLYLTHSFPHLWMGLWTCNSWNHTLLYLRTLQFQRSAPLVKKLTLHLYHSWLNLILPLLLNMHRRIRQIQNSKIFSWRPLMFVIKPKYQSKRKFILVITLCWCYICLLRQCQGIINC